MVLRYAGPVLLLLAAGPSLAATATPEQRADLLAVRDQMLSAIAPCDQKMGDLDANLRANKPSADTRATADEADRICEASRAAFATMRVPTSVDAAAQAQIKQAGQKWAAAMSARRRAISAARDYLQKPDKATAEIYQKRVVAAQDQIGEGAKLLMAAGKSVGIDLMK
jgi:hypothetical protein